MLSHRISGVHVRTAKISLLMLAAAPNKLVLPC